MLHLHRADGASALVDALGADLAVPAGDPLGREVVAVPARGVERWIAQRLGHRLGAGADGDGVCALVDMPRPDAVLDLAVQAANPQTAAAVDAWAPERTVWALLDVLDACPAGEEWCAGLRAHLGLDRPEQPSRRYAVARRVARLLDAYGRARPELLVAWAAGDGTGVPADLAWQPELWRRLRERLGSPHPAELLDDACAALRARPEAVPLPPRLSVFGATRLDAARLQVLVALAAGREVHLWLHVASPALWEQVAANGAVPVRRADAVVRPRHPLLGSLSRDVRELQLRLRAAAPDAVVHAHDPPRPPATTLLQRLQDDLRADRLQAQRAPVAAADRSVQVHACHGRARQVEVLREVVVGLLRDDPTLEPRDVLVLCPDVEAFAPLVAAAFGTPGHPASGLRVALADRSPRQVNPVLGVAARLLELAQSRVTATQLLDLAGAPPVRRRFRLDDDALEQLRGWAVESGVRWACSAEQRRPWHLQDVAQGTWRDGLDRLLAGVVTAGGVLGGTLPLDVVDSSDVELAGRAAELVDRVEAALERLRAPQPVADWLDALEDAVLQLAEPEEAWQLAQLRRQLGEVREAAEGSSAVLGLGDAAALLADRLAGRPTTTSFRTGGLTVCTLTPMRSVPHRVVCLLGLDDGAFPRHGAPDSDDLLAREPRLGERDPRSEDRQLLLDALSAAGEHLVVTYEGADVRTGAALPPAVPLGELLDALDATATAPDGRPVREHVVVRHPLQPFDPRCFTEAVSFDAVAAAGARAAAGERVPAPPLVPRALPAPAPEPDVALGRLVALLQHPARGFLRQRLDVAPAAREEEPRDALPVALDDLERWAVAERVLDARLRGDPPEQVRAAELARGALPPGRLGEAALDRAERLVGLLVEASAPFRAVPARSVELVVALPGDRRLLGTVSGARGDVLLTVTSSTVRAKHLLRAWVELLAAVAGEGRALSSVLVGKDKGAEGDAVRTTRLGPVEPGEARERLADLVALRDAGLCAPLPLPVGAGEAYARARRKDSVVRATERARAQWEGTWDRPGERDDEEHLLLHGGRLPFDELWASDPGCPEPGRGHEEEPSVAARLARRLWEPLLEAEAGGR
ncbi:MAG TPA: exodeoxyribonuclease V subunit gamma [Mycobacteriales bacterium]|nr:exodeoxyribonuclease V subunit gamma [Mycobacteriales bacterium]